ncbi:OmpA/MotB protein [Catenovulum agarivorans DS-2]|uniref:OmpA/MotB protein n=1 Tax=Catenovulum agarivorans DS-2 TaxID=1328313 RepID=W7QD84_9ALTE|nr:OmpA family protein [Catenovulum agarivorans]EWH10864.1 OmpA/MotB protein [Catenovulum agarivorans DS-2]
MKKRALKNCMFPLVLATIPQANADEANLFDNVQDQWIAVFGQYYKADDDKLPSKQMFEEGEVLGGEYGVRFNANWGSRLELSNIYLDQGNGSDNDEKAASIGLDALYYLAKSDYYLLGGLRLQNFDDARRAMTAGVGRHWAINQDWRIVTELAALHDFGQSHNDMTAKLGIAYHFGGSENSSSKSDRARSRLNADRDQDGVANRYDKCANTPNADEVDQFGCSQFVEATKTSEFKIFFAKESAELNSINREEVEDFVAFMKNNPEVEAVIEGHASKPGDKQFNMALSADRAKAVKQMLVNQYGISSGRIREEAYGESDPVMDSGSKLARKVNRRAEATVSKTIKVKLTEQ